MKKKTYKQCVDSKAWASYRIRGIKTSLEALKENPEISGMVKTMLKGAYNYMLEAVRQLDKEKQL